MAEEFTTSRKHALLTGGSVGLGVCGNRALNLMKRSKYNGDAFVEFLISLSAPSRNRVLCHNASVAGLGKRRLEGGHRGVRVMFRSPALSFGPGVGVHSVIYRPLVGFGGVGGSRGSTIYEGLLRVMRLPKSFTSHCPRGVDNKRHRHITVTETLTLRPRVIILSRTASTLSISIRGAMVRLVAGLRERGGVAFNFVYRSVTLIRLITRRMTIVCLKGLMRILPKGSLSVGTVRPCAETLVNTMFSVGVSFSGPVRDVRDRTPDPLSLPRKYPFRKEYRRYVSVYGGRGPGLIRIRSKRDITYRLFRGNDGW